MATLIDLDDYHARMLVELGLNDQVRSLLQTLPANDPSLDKAFAEAELGMEQPALEEARKQLAEAPTDTLMTVEFEPSVQAAVALSKGRPAEAIQLLQSAQPYEMRDPTMPYLRGRHISRRTAAKRQRPSSARSPNSLGSPTRLRPWWSLRSLAWLVPSRSRD